MKNTLQAGGLALVLALAAGAMPASAQDHDGRYHERGQDRGQDRGGRQDRGQGQAAPQQQGPQQAPRPEQAGRAPQGGQNWQGRGRDQRGGQPGQGQPGQGHPGQGRFDRDAQMRAQAQFAGRQRDRVQFQGQRPGAQPGSPDYRGQFRDQQVRAQADRDRGPGGQQYDRGRYGQNGYGQNRDGRQDRYNQQNRYDRQDRGRPDQYRGNQARRDDRYGDQRNWNRGWHSDRRYDWNSYRYSNRNAFRLGGYYAPYRGYSYRRIGVGFSLQPLFFGSSYWIGDPFQYRLPPAYGPYRWVRYYDDALLVNVYTGEVVDTVYDIFW